MKVLKIGLPLLLLFAFQKSLLAQDPPIEWDIIPKSDLQMTLYPKDPDATAVILCDYGQSHISDDFEVEYNRITRIKILNKNGFKWGTFSIPIRHSQPKEEIYDIKGATYNLDSNGKMITTELSDDDIFKQDLSDDVTLYRFTLPNLKPGCIVQVKYTIDIDNLNYMPNWTFQTSEPTLWSEYRICAPVNMVYAIVYRGYEPWFANDVQKVKSYFNGKTADILGANSVDCYLSRYVVKDVPAIRDEPFVTTIDDYKNQVNVQLSSYDFYLSGEQHFLKDWKTVISALLDDDSFGGEINVTDNVKKTALNIVKGLTTDQQKIEAIYNWVSRSIVCNGEDRVTADKDVDDVLESKEGNDAEITFLLISLLKSCGINSSPVILSTRDNGKIWKIYPLVNQFNYVIAMAKADSQTYFLDATDPYRPYNLTPEKMLGVEGLIVKKDTAQWVTFKANNPNFNNVVVNLNLDNNGSISGNMQEFFGNYKSLDIRDNLDGKKDKELAESLFNTESENVSIDSAVVTDKDSIETSFKIQDWFSSLNYAQKYGKMIYLDPLIVNRIKENPFKSAIRHFPVDYGYPRQTMEVINITLPNCFEIKDPPDNKVYRIDNNNVYYEKLIQREGNKVQIISKMAIGQDIIQPEDYDKLKKFYSLVVSSESEQLAIGPKETKDGDQKMTKQTAQKETSEK